MADVKKEPNAIDLLKQNYSKAKKILTTTTSAHSEAYLAAQKAHLTGKDGYVDNELLEKGDIQKKFLDTMVKYYIDKASKELKIKEKPKDAIEEDRILKTYANITREELNRMIKSAGKDYTLNQHEGIRDELMKAIKEQLFKSAGGHIGKEHTGALVKAMGLDDIVDSGKMEHTDALQLYSMYDGKGDKLTAGDIKNYYKQRLQPSPIYMKSPKKEKDYKKAA